MVVHWICGSCGDVLVPRRAIGSGKKREWRHRSRNSCKLPAPTKRDGPPPGQPGPAAPLESKKAEPAPQAPSPPLRDGKKPTKGYDPSAPRKSYTLTDEQLAILKERYNELADQGRLAELAEQLGVPVYVIRNRGRALGLSKPTGKRRQGRQKAGSPKTSRLTAAEVRVLEMLRAAGNLYEDLAVLHPADVVEWKAALHRLVTVVGCRVARRSDRQVLREAAEPDRSP